MCQVVQKRPVARQAKTHTINGLVHQARRLRQKAEKDEGRRAKLEAKADRLVKEVLFLKVNTWPSWGDVTSGEFDLCLCRWSELLTILFQ